MKLALKTYGWLEATLHEEQVGFEDEESNDKEQWTVSSLARASVAEMRNIAKLDHGQFWQQM